MLRIGCQRRCVSGAIGSRADRSRQRPWRPYHSVRRASRHGITLLDIVLTILILGIIGAVALPRFGQTWRRLSVHAGAQQFASQLNAARRLAVTTSQPVLVAFSSSPPTMTLRNASTNALLNQFSLASDLPQGTVTASFGGQATFQINSFGQPSTSGQITLTSAGVSRVIASQGSTNWEFLLQ